MIKQSGIDFVNLEDSQFDVPFGEASGAAVIFGATGGVMEAPFAVADILTGKDLEAIDYSDVRGIEGIKEATVEIAGKNIRVAVVNGLGTPAIFWRRYAGEAQYEFIEVMACPGGCITGAASR